MRPEILYPLFSPVQSLPGVGPKLATLIARAAGPRAVDLCFHLPAGLIDRRHSPAIAQCRDGEIVTLTVTVGRHMPPSRRHRPYRVLCGDGTGEIVLIFFHANRDYLKSALPEGAQRVISGKVEVYAGQLQMSHPDHIVPPEQRDTVATVEPVYGLTSGLTAKVMNRAVAAALARMPELPEWHEPEWRQRQDWPAWRAAVVAVHHPAREADLEPNHAARQRLAYDELLANQLALAIVRRRLRRRRGRALAGDDSLCSRARAGLPFSLTPSQETTIAEIIADMAVPERMTRLLQGDVGSGKTVVAMMAMLTAVEAGTQAALLAPTEILARQHFLGLQAMGEAAGVRIAILTGRDKGKARDAILEAVATGEIDILVGTHALIEKDVAFRDLGLAVIDEQHRFGVHQRLGITEKGKAVDLLVMTATPIPRTLTLTAYGDMEVSRLLEKPPGRRPVDTRAMPNERLNEVETAVGRAIADGRQVYWICPLVAESESSDLAAAEARAAHLKERFGTAVGLMHGRMKAEEKDAVMAAFTAGEIRILVSTTVVEVGVDVPMASIMIIEHAERFGLAQLHQLRGRVGRGSAASTCVLLYAPPLSDAARARLKILRETEDGFRIAEEDLKLRGGGEVLGTRQSGFPEFRLADLVAHADLLEAARDDARLILERDESLATARGQALRVLLYLFERDAAIGYIGAG